MSFQNLERDLNIPVHEAHTFTNKLNSKRSFPRYIITNLSKIKDKEAILKEAREKEACNLQKHPHKAISRFLSRNLIVVKVSISSNSGYFNIIIW